jgi:hypothetical protein
MHIHLPREVWQTSLGGFLSGAVGILLFFFQRWKEKADEQQDILFRIFQLVLGPEGIVEGAGEGQYYESLQRLRDLRALAFFVKDRELARAIYPYTTWAHYPCREEMLQKISNKLNKKLYQELAQAKPAPTQSPGSESEKK